MNRQQRLQRRLDNMTLPLNIYAINRGMAKFQVNSELAAYCNADLSKGPIFDEAAWLTSYETFVPIGELHG